MNDKEAEEYAKLLQEAKRIQGLFDDMKSANSELPGLPKSPPPALKAEFDPAATKQSAESVAETIFTALKNNNSPAPNHGLQVTLENSSPLNPVKSQPFERFAQIMEQGKYSILLGKFERFSVLPAQPGSGDGSAQISLVDVKVTAAPEAFERCQMPERYLEPADSGKLAVTFRLQLRRGDETAGRWMSDTLYLLAPANTA